MSKTIIARVVSDAVWDQAYKMICKQRINHHPNSDIWHIRFHWNEIKPMIKTQVANGQYQFDPARVCLLNGQYINVFGSRDAIVLKALSIVLSPHVKQRVSKRCFHVAGRGGIKGVVHALD
jgi:RNA-directed DNA polymerase